MEYFDKTWNTEVIVDASPVGLGAVLGQYNTQKPSERKIVCFATRLLTAAEKRYSQCEKEACAAVWGCERYWLYLFGKPFKLLTDNHVKHLIFANTKSRPPARIDRMALGLSQFDSEIQHCPGETNFAD